MGQPADLNPSSFNLPGGTTGVLLTHGIPGLLLEMWPPGDYPHARGITVSAPVSPDRSVAVGEFLADRVYALIHRRTRSGRGSQGTDSATSTLTNGCK